MLLALAAGPINMEYLIYGVLGLAALLMIAVSFFVVRGGASKTVLMTVAGFGGMLAGLAIGIMVMFYLQGTPSAAASEHAAGSGPAAGGNEQGGGPGGGGGGGRRGGGGGAAMSVGPRRSMAQTQLPNLLARLELLTGKKPLNIELTDEQKKQIRDQLQGLGDLKELTADEADKRIEALQDAVKDHREVLEALGYRWTAAGEPPMMGGGRGGMGGGFGGPGMGGMGGPGMGGPGMGGLGGPGMGGPGMGAGGGRGSRGGEAPANPFTEERNRKHLDSLLERVGGAKAEAPKT